MFGIDLALLSQSRLARAGIALTGMLLLAWLLVSALNSHDRAQRNAGGAEIKATELSQTVKHVEQANEVRAEIHDPRSPARYDQCLRSARTRANCERFLPQRSGNLDRSGTGPGR